MKSKKFSLLFSALALMVVTSQVYAEDYYYEGGYYQQPSYSSYSYDDGYYAAPQQQEYYEPPRYRARTSPYAYSYDPSPFYSRMPQQIAPGQKAIVIDPNQHAWGAYSADGRLIRAGVATAGQRWCPDIGRPCRTKAGTFRIFSLGGPDCYSKKFPLGRGGAPMPYCMFFHGGQALHGSNQVADANLSHGCVRLNVSDARWLRYEFANIGTKVIVRPY